jgi:hypothetical protein
LQPLRLIDVSHVTERTTGRDAEDRHLLVGLVDEALSLKDLKRAYQSVARIQPVATARALTFDFGMFVWLDCPSFVRKASVVGSGEPSPGEVTAAEDFFSHGSLNCAGVAGGRFALEPDLAVPGARDPR